MSEQTGPYAANPAAGRLVFFGMHDSALCCVLGMCVPGEVDPLRIDGAAYRRRQKARRRRRR